MTRHLKGWTFTQRSPLGVIRIKHKDGTMLPLLIGPSIEKMDDEELTGLITQSGEWPR